MISDKVKSCALALSVCSVALAEAAAEVPAAVDPASQITPLMILEKGGGLMYVIAGLSLLAITLTIFYALTLRAGTKLI